MNKCYLCKQNPVKYLFTNNNYPIYRCTHCGLGMAKLDRAYEEFVKDYYNQGYFKGDASRCAYTDYDQEFKHFKKNFLGILNEIKKYQSEGKLLDIGCATGRFMELSYDQGFKVFGIEPSPYAAKVAKKRFTDSISESTMETANFPESCFNVITMLDVFEHLSDPREDLKRCHRWLSENGLLVIATDDFDSLWAKLLGQKWHFLIPPQHLFFFSKRTLSRILNEEGFKVERVVKSGKWITLGYGLHLSHAIQGNKLAGFVKSKLEDTRLASLPLYLNFRDHMVVFARKVK